MPATEYGREEGCRHNTLTDLLHWRAQNQPHQLAYKFLVDEETEDTLTYAELDKRARDVAAILQSSGVDGERVLLLYPPGLEFTSAFFGCLYASRIAVPAYPPRVDRHLLRVQAIANDAGASKVLTTVSLLPKLRQLFESVPGVNTLTMFSTDDMDGMGTEWKESAPPARNSLAFLQYTSGSTGMPKGVMLTHGNLLHNASLIYQVLEHTSQDKYVSWLPTFHDMGFMAGVLQPLYGGFPSIMLSPLSFLQSPVRWLQTISCYKGTTSGGPNFAYELCVNKINPEHRETLDLSSWTVAFNGAEPIRAETLDRFATTFEPCGFRREAFYPCYGLAEATLMVSGGLKSAPPRLKRVSSKALKKKVVVDADRNSETKLLVGCGRAMPGQKIAIVNPEWLARCAPQEVGEIWVAGNSIGQGYWNREKDTQQTFQAFLKTGEGPFLRTGDLGILQGDEVFVTGRLKDLIIIRGINHYPQDIELTVESCHPALRSGCGAAFSVEIAGEERLALVQEVDHRQHPDLAQLATTIRQVVAQNHEIQAYAVVFLKSGTIPKTSSGKIQRRACKTGFLKNQLDEIFRSTSDESSPSWIGDSLTPELLLTIEPEKRHALLESHLQRQVARVLKVSADDVKLQVPLAYLGLDSLMFTELRNRVESDLRTEISLVTLLEAQSLSQLASYLLNRISVSGPASILCPVTKPAAVAEMPLSYMQRAIWFLYQLAPESPAYNISFAASIGSEVDLPALQRAFQALIQRHPCLRTTFTMRGDQPAQVIHEHMPMSFVAMDASTWGEAELNNRLMEDAHRPFDLEKGPLLRVGLYTRSEKDHVLLLSVHHIAIDGWSFWILLDELGTLYRKERGEIVAPLAHPSAHYSDYLHWQEEMLKSSRGEQLWSYWRRELSGELPTLNLPYARTRPPVQTYNGATHSFVLSRALTRQLKALATSERVTLYVLLLAAFQLLLYRYSNQEDIVVGSPTSGRRRTEFESVVGCFFNVVVLRARLSKDLRFSEFLQQVRDTVARALEHEDYPSHLLAERLQPVRDLSRPPLFQATFIMQRPRQLAEFSSLLSSAGLDLGGLKLRFRPLERRSVRSDLEMELIEGDGTIFTWLQYNTDLFDQDTIARMAGHFQTLLQNIVVHPEQRIVDLPLLTEIERQQILSAWSNSGKKYSIHAYIEDLFEEQARKTPGKVAVAHEHSAMTFKQLSKRSADLANVIRGLR